MLNRDVDVWEPPRATLWTTSGGANPWYDADKGVTRQSVLRFKPNLFLCSQWTWQGSLAPLLHAPMYFPAATAASASQASWQNNCLWPANFSLPYSIFFDLLLVEIPLSFQTVYFIFLNSCHTVTASKGTLISCLILKSLRAKPCLPGLQTTFVQMEDTFYLICIFRLVRKLWNFNGLLP